MYYDICLSWSENSLEFLRICFSAASRRKRLLVVFNLLFFGCVFFVASLVQFFILPPLSYPVWSPDVPEVFLGSGLIAMVLGIFVFNLVVSAFVVVTLPGIAFFPLSIGFLLFRAALWGLLICGLPTWLFLAALPTLMLEGEAYVLAAVAGTVAGVSWIKPNVLHYKEEALGRSEVFRRALNECLRLYLFVAVLLLVAAIVETATIVLIE